MPRDFCPLQSTRYILHREVILLDFLVENLKKSEIRPPNRIFRHFTVEDAHKQLTSIRMPACDSKHERLAKATNICFELHSSIRSIIFDRMKIIAEAIDSYSC